MQEGVALEVALEEGMDLVEEMVSGAARDVGEMLIWGSRACFITQGGTRSDDGDTGRRALCALLPMKYRMVVVELYR
jgi:hypothetical protein